MGESNAAVNSRPRVSRETMLAAAAAYQGKPDGGPDKTFPFSWVGGEGVNLFGNAKTFGAFDATNRSCTMLAVVFPTTSMASDRTARQQ